MTIKAIWCHLFGIVPTCVTSYQCGDLYLCSQLVWRTCLMSGINCSLVAWGNLASNIFTCFVTPFGFVWRQLAFSRYDAHNRRAVFDLCEVCGVHRFLPKPNGALLQCYRITSSLEIGQSLHDDRSHFGPFILEIIPVFVWVCVGVGLCRYSNRGPITVENNRVHDCQ